MSERTILRNGTVDITTKVARFEAISFQVSTIGSVSVFNARKFNPWAIALILFAIVAFLVGFHFNGVKTLDGQIAFAIGVLFAVGSFVVQSLWPSREFTFVLKSCSGEVYKLVSNNGPYLDSLQRALETAFAEQT